MRPNPLCEKRRACDTALGVMALERFAPRFPMAPAQGWTEFLLLDSGHSDAGMETIKA